MIDAHHTTCIVLLGSGAAVMVAAFIPVRDICMDARAQAQVCLGFPALIGFFIVGYVSSAFVLIEHATEPEDLLVATALFGSACFMWAIAQISRLIIRET